MVSFPYGDNVRGALFAMWQSPGKQGDCLPYGYDVAIARNDKNA